MIVKIKRLNNTAIIPTRGSEYAAGYDLYASLDKDVFILKDEVKKIGTGIAMEIPDGYFGAVFARSGLATKAGLRPANCVGVIDSDYRGEIIVPIHSDRMPYEIHNGDRIAQIVMLPYLPVAFEAVESLSDTKRSTGGFGSTGIGQDSCEIPGQESLI